WAFSTLQARLLASLQLLIELAIAIGLWWNAERISRAVLPSETSVDTSSLRDLQRIETTAFAILGVYVLVFAIAGVALLLANFLPSLSRETLPGASRFGVLYLPGVVSSLVQLALGWALVTRPAELARMLARFQSLPKGETNSDE